MGQNSKIQTSKNSVITKALYNNSLSHTTHFCSERFKKAIINSAKVILKKAKFNGQFREDAISTANYIHNRIPHNGGINQQVPYMNYYTTKMVDYNKFKVFGCLVFYYVPKQLRKKSSIISPLLGIFISYDDTSYTAYRIYDFYNYKIITSKVVRILRRHFSECLCTTLLSFFYSLFPFFFWSWGGNRWHT